MHTGHSHTDERGAVYVEFLIAFFPLFTLFLGLCQLSLVVAAQAVVHHSANVAVRSAIVVLEEDPKRFDCADRRDLTDGKARKVPGLDRVLEKLGVNRVSLQRAKRGFLPAALDGAFAQHGARMVPIRTAALLPLLTIAPSESAFSIGGESVSGALASSSDEQLGFAVEYTNAAALVSVHESPESQVKVVDPIEPGSPVTVRITYLFHCTIPLVRNLMCRSAAYFAEKENHAFAVGYKMQGIAPPDARFRLLSATATLPSQGARYLPREGEKCR